MYLDSYLDLGEEKSDLFLGVEDVVFKNLVVSASFGLYFKGLFGNVDQSVLFQVVAVEISDLEGLNAAVAVAAFN